MASYPIVSWPAGKPAENPTGNVRLDSQAQAEIDKASIQCCMKKKSQRRAGTGIIKQNTELCKTYKMRITNEAVNQATVPPLISHQWRPRSNLRRDHRMSENLWYTWWKIATGNTRDSISARPWRGYRVGPTWRRGGIPVVCRWWSQLCRNHQWERWLGGWMKHAQLLSLVVRTDAAWGFNADDRRIQAWSVDSRGQMGWTLGHQFEGANGLNTRTSRFWGFFTYNVERANQVIACPITLAALWRPSVCADANWSHLEARTSIYGQRRPHSNPADVCKSSRI